MRLSGGMVLVPIRSRFLAKAAENELRRRRSHACRDLPGSTPETNHNEFLILSITAASRASARPPPPPIRYQVYPSVTEERWSINEILRWYSAERLQRELRRFEKVAGRRAKKWTDEKWYARGLFKLNAVASMAWSTSRHRDALGMIIRDKLPRSADGDNVRRTSVPHRAREEGKRQRGSRKGMVEEDERSRLMRQALLELKSRTTR